MKKLFIFSIFFSLTIFANYVSADWKRSHYDSEGNNYYLNFDEIKKKNNIVIYKTKVLILMGKGMGFGKFIGIMVSYLKKVSLKMAKEMVIGFFMMNTALH